MNKKTNILLLAINIILSVSILSYLVYTQNITSNEKDFMNSLKVNLQNHEEFKDTEWEYPRITLLTSNLLDIANQRGIEFYDKAKEGDYLLEFTGASMIYNYKYDEIVDILVFETIPQDILVKLTAHEGLENYKAMRPDVIKISQENLENLKQQIDGLDETQIGNYIISYQDLVILYDYTKDLVVNSIRFEFVPQDLLLKLTTHEEMEEYRDVRPLNIIVVKQDNLQTLQQQIGGLDESYIGSYIITYPEKIVIYDYINDKVLMNQALRTNE